jgi:hypothetical protein
MEGHSEVIHMPDERLTGTYAAGPDEFARNNGFLNRVGDRNEPPGKLIKALGSPIVRGNSLSMRKLLWLPCVVVFLVSLFAPEIACISTHLLKSREVVLGKYHIRTPLTHFGGGDYNAYLWTLSAPGIARLGFRKYWERDIPVSEMSFYPVQHPEKQLVKNVPLDGETVLAKRSIRFGQQIMNCWYVIHHSKFVGSSPADPALADIACSTDNDDFYTRFSGWRSDAPTFYETLQGITLTE